MISARQLRRHAAQQQIEQERRAWLVLGLLAALLPPSIAALYLCPSPPAIAGADSSFHAWSLPAEAHAESHEPMENTLLPPPEAEANFLLETEETLPELPPDAEALALQIDLPAEEPLFANSEEIEDAPLPKTAARNPRPKAQALDRRQEGNKGRRGQGREEQHRAESKASRAESSPTNAASGRSGGKGAAQGFEPPAYLENPQPPYPPALLGRRLQGTVQLRISIDREGRPVSAELISSSGHAELDRLARDWVLKHWRFKAARQAGQAVAATLRSSICFRLR